ncbi:MAG: hypothetical protein MUF62_01560 [Chitinophagaceae bacterium]|jgi:hypothetical protein|nr:hypothetical protein [Chitinophagaceae bacterium]
MQLFLVSLLSGLLFWHPFYVSVVEINHNPTDQTLETSVRIFTDDFENTLKMRYPGQKIDLYNPPVNGNTDSLISRYLAEKMQVRLNGRPVRLKYLGFERVEESIWCYLEVPGVKSVQQLHISNRLLYEYKKEQINMHHVQTGGQKKSYKLNNPETEVDFQF